MVLKRLENKLKKRIGHVKARIREKQEAYHSARNAAENAGEQYNLTDFIFHKPTIKNIKKMIRNIFLLMYFLLLMKKGNLYVVKQQTKLFPRMHRFYCLKIILTCWKDIKSAKENTNDIKINSKADMPEAEKNNFLFISTSVSFKGGRKLRQFGN